MFLEKEMGELQKQESLNLPQTKKVLYIGEVYLSKRDNTFSMVDINYQPFGRKIALLDKSGKKFPEKISNIVIYDLIELDKVVIVKDWDLLKISDRWVEISGPVTGSKLFVEWLHKKGIETLTEQVNVSIKYWNGDWRVSVKDYGRLDKTHRKLREEFRKEIREDFWTKVLIDKDVDQKIAQELGYTFNGDEFSSFESESEFILKSGKTSEKVLNWSFGGIVYSAERIYLINNEEWTKYKWSIIPDKECKYPLDDDGGIYTTIPLQDVKNGRAREKGLQEFFDLDD